MALPSLGMGSIRLGVLALEVAMKKALIAIGIVVVLLIVVALALPFLIDVNRFKPTLEADLSMALGRKVEIGNIQLALLQGSVKVNDISIADDPEFSNAPFLQAKQLAAGVALQPLIFSKKLQVSSFTITEPQVVLLHAASGKWNYSSLGAGAKSTSTSNSSSSSDFSVDKIKIENGTVKVGRIGPGGKTQTYQNVNLEASNLSYTTQFPFELDAKTPGNGSVKVDGKAGPIDRTDASLTPLAAKVDVENVDLASTGFVDPSSGLAGLVSFNGQLASDGKQMTSNGNVKADKIKLVANGTPSHVPLNVDYDTNYDLKSQTGILSKGDVHVGKALAHLTGYIRHIGRDGFGKNETGRAGHAGDGSARGAASGGSHASVGRVAFERWAECESHTRRAGRQAGDRGAGEHGECKIRGIQPEIEARGAFFLDRNWRRASGTDTDIQTFSANLRVDPQGEKANNVNLVVPSIGTITGNGTVSASQQLDCKMVAKVVASGGAIGGVASILGGGSGGGKSALTIPFHGERNYRESAIRAGCIGRHEQPGEK